MRRRRRSACIGIQVLTVVIVAFLLREASAFRARKSSSQDLWQGYKSILLLPVRNETPTGGQGLANLAAHEWIANLHASKKFSVEFVHGRNPAVIRALKESILKADEFARWQQQGQLDDAFAVASPLGIDFVGELKVTGYAVQEKTLDITVDGSLYDVLSRQRAREVVVTASAPIPRKNPDTARIERTAMSAVTRKVVDAFLGRNIAEPQMKKKDRTKKPKVETKSSSSPSPAPSSSK